LEGRLEGQQVIVSELNKRCLIIIVAFQAAQIRPMKIDIMFLVPARMGVICRTKIFHYSLFLKNRLNKTPNSSPDQSLIAAFRKRNSNGIFLKTLLARMPLFFMSALVCVEIYCRVGRIKLK
jgi:hypothetical protein